VSMEERYRVFNMGIGMVLVIEKNNLSSVESCLNSINEPYYLVGQVIEKKGSSQVIIK